MRRKAFILGKDIAIARSIFHSRINGSSVVVTAIHLLLSEVYWSRKGRRNNYCTERRRIFSNQDRTHCRKKVYSDSRSSTGNIGIKNDSKITDLELYSGEKGVQVLLQMKPT